MNTKKIGDISVANVLAAFLTAGKTVLTPFGDCDRYDLVVEENGQFERIQVKTGILKKGVIEFNTCSTTTSNGKLRYMPYQGQIDTFAIYYPGNKKIYLVPIALCGNRATSLRLVPPKNKQIKNIHLASTYEFDKIVKK